MRHEIGDRHFAGEKEGDRTSEEAKRQKDAAGEFENAGTCRQSGERMRLGSGREVEQLLRAMFDELQGGHDAQYAQRLWPVLSKAFEKLHLKLQFYPRSGP